MGSLRQADRGGPAQPLLIAKGLKKHFPIRSGFFGKTRRVHAVDGISFEVAKGETLGIVGESGCGKSTTSRLLLHLTPPDDGEIIFDGDLVGAGGISVREMRRSAQMVFQDSFTSLNPRSRILDIVMFPLRASKADARSSLSRARFLLNRVGLDPDRFGDRFPHELSGGQRQRVNIARALATSPRLVILDEAVSALDKSIEAEVINLLDDLKSELGLTYLFISHDLHVVRHVSDRVMVMYLGQVVEIGEAEALYERPMHPYTRSLLSAMPSMDPDKRTETAPLAGDPPNPVDPAPGCRFRPRCPFAEEVCIQQDPALINAKSSLAACHMCNLISGHSKAADWLKQTRTDEMADA
ncbi:ABC transporter ATP-binding protein [Consotaella aegiceratis]|uniref:ABC transporter ATP-binding protein n=1 Tax=Consotaella aegiceratis TaxID=3097961 RepID=UPI002F3EC9CE